MMNRIIEVKKFHDLKIKKDITSLSYDDRFSGYQIKTEHGYYVVGVDYGQSCCEYTSSECLPDDFSSFIGSEIINIETVVAYNGDSSYKKSSILKKIESEDGGLDCYEAAFVIFETNNGPMEFAVYNLHNGYYGHDVFVTKLDHSVFEVGK
jgi:hypothetical protein